VCMKRRRLAPHETSIIAVLGKMGRAF